MAAHLRYWREHSFDVEVFPGNCIEPKSQLPSNETVNIHSKCAITRRRVAELFDLVARRILETEVYNRKEARRGGKFEYAEARQKGDNLNINKG